MYMDSLEVAWSTCT